MQTGVVDGGRFLAAHHQFQRGCGGCHLAGDFAQPIAVACAVQETGKYLTNRKFQASLLCGKHAADDRYHCAVVHHSRRNDHAFKPLIGDRCDGWQIFGQPVFGSWKNPFSDSVQIELVALHRSGTELQCSAGVATQHKASGDALSFVLQGNAPAKDALNTTGRFGQLVQSRLDLRGHLHFYLVGLDFADKEFAVTGVRGRCL